MPFLGRNMGLVGSVMQVILGVTIMLNYPYRDGIEAVEIPSLDPVTKAPNTERVALTSNTGIPMLLLCLFGGAGMFIYEFWTFGRSTVHADRFHFQIRVAAYLILGAPGILTFGADTLMPPLIGSLFYIITGCVQLAGLYGTPPTEKEWRWAWGRSKEAKKRADNEGGKFNSCCDIVFDACRSDKFHELNEQGRLSRVLALLVYLLINVLVGGHAYFRHGYSEKGKALMGKSFLACPVRSGEHDEPGFSPVPVNLCFVAIGDSCEATLSYRCKNGDAPTVMPEVPKLQEWWVGFGWLGYPTAKMCGQLLNLNCAVLVAPVTHGLVLKLQGLSSIKGPPLLRWLNPAFQLDKAVVVHKMVAKYLVLLFAFVHGLLHYFNYGRAPYYSAIFKKGVYPSTPVEAAWGFTYKAYGLTGQLITLAMFCIYSGAHDTVKRRHYETFWYTHHMFILFYLALFFHGSVFIFWALASLIPYAIDRVFVRVLYRGRKKFALARVYFWGKPGKVPECFTLQFSNSSRDASAKPMDYMEGHYLYLNCPHVESGSALSRVLPQWHPITISSAPDENVLEVNIRVMPSPHSWSHQVVKYLQLFDPLNEGAIEFTTRNQSTGDIDLGKVLGPDGKPFFSVDGPHGAPSQHVFNYNTAMIVGAGIGVTPCSSIMRGIVRYRWKKGYGPKMIYFFWVARLTDLDYFKWLLVMLPELKAEELTHNEYYGGNVDRTEALRARMDALKEEAKLAELRSLQAGLREASTNQRRLEITLYLTGAKASDVKEEDNPEPGSRAELIKALLVAKDPFTGEPYIKLKAGRPDWPNEFKGIAQTHGREDIGVCFCGAPAIAHALKENCEKVSKRDGAMFRLHKENF